MNLKRIHHVAYRCNDARETVDFYRDVLGMEFQLAFAEDTVPSTGAPDPYMHVFLDAGMGNVLAFFELPNAPAHGQRPQHAGLGAAHRVRGKRRGCPRRGQGTDRGRRPRRHRSPSTTVCSTPSTSSTPTDTAWRSPPTRAATKTGARARAVAEDIAGRVDAEPSALRNTRAGCMRRPAKVSRTPPDASRPGWPPVCFTTRSTTARRASRSLSPSSRRRRYRSSCSSALAPSRTNVERVTKLSLATESPGVLRQQFPPALRPPQRCRSGTATGVAKKGQHAVTLRRSHLFSTMISVGGSSGRASAAVEADEHPDQTRIHGSDCTTRPRYADRRRRFAVSTVG